MVHAFSEFMFTPRVKSVQARLGSRGAYERFEEPEAPARDRLGPEEAAFIARRDSFYLATVSETGWPYVQHRGGPPGFLKVLDERTLAFADFRGNRQYVSVGNLLGDDRVSLILMDYPNRRRLKILGRVRLAEPAENADVLALVQPPDYRARAERAFVIDVAAFDWNCPQHITSRFTEAELEERLRPLRARLSELEASSAATVLGQLGPLASAINPPPLQTSKEITMTRPPLPPFDAASARDKVRLAEDAWNSRDPARVALAYTPDSQWRNRAEFINGREEIIAFLTRKWRKELDYRLVKEPWAFTENRIAVRFAYEWHDDSGQWFRSYGNENWEFDDHGLMRTRLACINDMPIAEADRKFHWPLGRRPDDTPELTALGL